MVRSWKESWQESWAYTWGMPVISGTGILVCNPSDLTGNGTVTGSGGSGGDSRPHYIQLDPEPITHRR
jgi:hypothetical protein